MSEHDEAPDSKHVLEVRIGSDEPLEAGRARFLLAPSVRAARTAMDWSKSLRDLDINAVVDEIDAQAAAASRSDLTRSEAILVAQAHTLDVLFDAMCRRARWNINDYPDAAEKFLRVALRAQSQCRATIETLAEMKNPRPLAFVSQANFANGPQQVNNGVATRADEKSISQNELLEQTNGQRLDFGTAGKTLARDPALEAVEPVNRAANRGRKRKIASE